MESSYQELSPYPLFQAWNPHFPLINLPKKITGSRLRGDLGDFKVTQCSSLQRRLEGLAVLGGAVAANRGYEY